MEFPLISRSGPNDEILRFEYQQEYFNQIKHAPSILELRKLREAIISSKRSDFFAIEVYEYSAKVCAEKRDMEELFKCTTVLVKDLYHKIPPTYYGNPKTNGSPSNFAYDEPINAVSSIASNEQDYTITELLFDRPEIAGIESLKDKIMVNNTLQSRYDICSLYLCYIVSNTPQAGVLSITFKHIIKLGINPTKMPAVRWYLSTNNHINYIELGRILLQCNKNEIMILSQRSKEIQEVILKMLIKCYYQLPSDKLKEFLLINQLGNQLELNLTNEIIKLKKK